MSIHDKYQLNITEVDFLEYPEDIKYDLQVVNPPYAKINESITMINICEISLQKKVLLVCQ